MSSASSLPNITHEAGHCLWYGQCGPSGKVDSVFNCFYNGPAKNVTPNSEFQKAIKNICPQYVDGPVCCDKAQLDTLISQISTAQGFFNRCPACLRNFLNVFCATTCDPNSSQFLDGKLGLDKNGTVQVTSATVYLDDKFANGVFDSCKNVVNPSDNAQKVVELMCGGASPCTTTAWFKYLGSLNPYVPFPMTYKFDNGSLPKPKGMVAENITSYPCDYHDGADYSLQCSCTDCGTAEVCPPPPSPPKETFPRVLVMMIVGGAGGFIVLLIFIIALVAGFIQLMCKPQGYSVIGGYGTMPEEGDEDSPTSSVGSINDDPNTNNDDVEGTENCLCHSFYKFGAYFEFWIKRVFYWWGKLMTRFWYIVIVAGLIVMGAFASGMYRFKVVTNTVELWSAPDSRARIEKNYFDENFGPFYRTEMIIVKPLDQDNYFDGEDANGGTARYGPAMAWNVLNEVRRFIRQVSLGTRPQGFPPRGLVPRPGTEAWSRGLVPRPGT